MHKTALVTIVVLASLAGAAVGQAPAPEPAWRESALAMVPSGYVAGQAYRTDQAGQTGYLSVYPSNANDPKSPASVFAPRQALVVRQVDAGRAQARRSARHRRRTETHPCPQRVLGTG